MCFFFIIIKHCIPFSFKEKCENFNLRNMQFFSAPIDETLAASELRGVLSPSTSAAFFFVVFFSVRSVSHPKKELPWRRKGGCVGINRSLRLLQMYCLTQEDRGGGRWRWEGGGVGQEVKDEV